MVSRAVYQKKYVKMGLVEWRAHSSIGYKPIALLLSYTSLSTYRLQGDCSSHLSYTGILTKVMEVGDSIELLTVS